MTVTLRHATAADLPWLDGWLPAVATLLGPKDGLAVREWLRPRSPVRARIIVRDGADAGFVAYRLAGRGQAKFELVATPPGHARRGSGMAAAIAAEREMVAAGARVVHAPAPIAHGISLYFWLRLGYRPLLRRDWPCECAGVVWVGRRL